MPKHVGLTLAQVNPNKGVRIPAPSSAVRCGEAERGGSGVRDGGVEGRGGVEEGAGKGPPVRPRMGKGLRFGFEREMGSFSSGGSIGRVRTLLFGETTLHLWSNIIRNVRWRPMEEVPHQTRMKSPRTPVFGGIGRDQEARGKMQAFQGAWEGHEGGIRAS